MTDSDNNIWKFAYDGLWDRLNSCISSDKALVTALDDSMRMPLHWAVSGGHLSIVQLLLDHGSPADTPDDSGWTPLVIGSSANRLQIVTLLLARGADVNHVTNTGQSALIYAASKGHQEILELLLRHHADPGLSDKYGSTALHRAASRGNTAVVKHLLTYTNQLNIDCADRRGNTPLHLSCEDQQYEVSRLLADAGASIDLQNVDEKTPIDLAPPNLAKTLRTITTLL